MKILLLILMAVGFVANLLQAAPRKMAKKKAAASACSRAVSIEPGPGQDGRETGNISAAFGAQRRASGRADLSHQDPLHDQRDSGGATIGGFYVGSAQDSSGGRSGDNGL